MMLLNDVRYHLWKAPHPSELAAMVQEHCAEVWGPDARCYAGGILPAKADAPAIPLLHVVTLAEPLLWYAIAVPGRALDAASTQAISRWAASLENQPQRRDIAEKLATAASQRLSKEDRAAMRQHVLALLSHPPRLLVVVEQAGLLQDPASADLSSAMTPFRVFEFRTYRSEQPADVSHVHIFEPLYEARAPAAEANVAAQAEPQPGEAYAGAPVQAGTPQRRDAAETAPAEVTPRVAPLPRRTLWSRSGVAPGPPAGERGVAPRSPTAAQAAAPALPPPPAPPPPIPTAAAGVSVTPGQPAQAPLQPRPSQPPIPGRPATPGRPAAPPRPGADPGAAPSEAVKCEYDGAGTEAPPGQAAAPEAHQPAPGLAAPGGPPVRTAESTPTIATQGKAPRTGPPPSLEHGDPSARREESVRRVLAGTTQEISELFITVRESIMKLGKGIDEVPGNWWIDYRKGVTFVSFVTPQLKRNSISVFLKMGKRPIVDPRDWTKKVSGSGDLNTVFTMTSVEQVDYAMSLIQQAWEFIREESKAPAREPPPRRG